MPVTEALGRLGASTVEAVTGVLEAFCPGQVRAGAVTVLAEGAHPLEAVPMPALAAGISYVDGVTGGNLFVMSLTGARALAAAMGVDEEAAEGELTELQRSAVAEAMNQMMAAAAGATGTVLGHEVQISTPETRILHSAAQAREAYPPATYATSTGLSLCGEPCRLVQLVPHSFVARMTRALSELGAELVGGAPAARPSPGGAGSPGGLGDVRVRVTAELGRARIGLGRLVGMPTGAVVDLDRAADDPVELLVNGVPFATGRLVVLHGSEWGVRVESLRDTTTRGGG